LGTAAIEDPEVLCYVFITFNHNIHKLVTLLIAKFLI